VRDADQPTLLYLEADDEITAVVRRVRAAGPGRVVIVAPGRSRATSSAVALRLLAAEDREVAVVGDALTRSLAAEAGLTAYATVDDARRAAPADPEAPVPRHAAIHVVRGSATDDAAPTLAAGAVPAAPASAASSASDAPTVATPVVRPVRRRPPRPAKPRPSERGARRRAFPVALVGLLAVLAVAGVVAGASLLPSAEIAITPRSEPIAARTYEIVVDDPEVLTGTVESAATATPTGSYTIQQPASGTAVFLNWTFFAVDVPAGSFVAAGEQAYATQAEITVPRGTLTSDGRIAAGEQAVAVVAAAIGPAANVAAGAIDTVLDEDIDARLRGFPENPERRVTNPERTSGGVDTTGTEFIQADVDAAVAALREDLAAKAAAALPEEDGSLVLEPATQAEPTISGVDGIVGTRDQEAAEITGTLTWTAYRVDREVVLDGGEEAFTDDERALPEGHRLLREATAVTLGDARLDGETVVVEAHVTGSSAPELDPEVLRARAMGRTAEEARLALADVGTAEIDLWPGWVSTVPELEWRVDVRIGELEPAEPGPSGSAEASP
jgi:hypothetical protein